MRIWHLAWCIGIIVSFGVAHAEEWTAVKIEKSWNVVIGKKEAAKIIGIEGVVAWQKRPMAISTQAAWKQVWSQWNPDAKLPKVDFSKKLILVHVKDAGDPNKVRHNVQVSNAGNLRVLSLTTLIGFQPTNQREYEFIMVPRDGVTHLAVPGKGNVPLSEVKSH